MAGSYRYNASISYAHEDEAFAASLRRRLARFVVPKQLRLVASARRLGTFFHDRDELASGGRLSESIVSVIEEAKFLIVVCSAASERCEWVGREITAFLRVRALDQVLPIDTLAQRERQRRRRRMLVAAGGAARRGAATEAASRERGVSTRVLSFHARCTGTSRV
jgi:hypothetical protein